VAEIAARRAVDVAHDLDADGRVSCRDRGQVAPPPRPVAERLAAPGCHLIAEVKRSSPSAGRIARADDDPVTRARAYASGGARMISVLCEPHWFSGSVEDLRAVRSAVSVPVLAKEFIVDERQLAVLRAVGADAVLLLAVLHPARRLAALVRLAWDSGLNCSWRSTGRGDRPRARDGRLIGGTTGSPLTRGRSRRAVASARSSGDRIAVAGRASAVSTVARWRPPATRPSSARRSSERRIRRLSARSLRRVLPADLAAAHGPP
jgi:hypothetical protein